MERIRVVRGGVVLLAAVVLAVVLGAPPAAAGEPQPGDVLPDLDQLVPTGLEVKRVTLRGRRAFHLGFSSAAANVGGGPLTLHGHRADRRRTRMDVDQLVSQVSGPSRLVRDVGVMSYVVHPDHRHWHLLGFERYAIRRAGTKRGSLRRDRKTGFCLGDRFAIEQASSMPAFNPTPLQADLCGMGEPGLLSLFSGISPGYGDRYEAHIEGQYIDVTGLPSGRYELVHTVNTEGRIVERDLTNNASSVLFSMRWTRGRTRAPRLRLLRQCPSTPTCAR